MQRRMGCAFCKRVRKLNTLEKGAGQHLKERWGRKKKKKKWTKEAAYRDCISEEDSGSEKNIIALKE